MLEEQVGARLFHRDRRVVRLTVMGGGSAAARPRDPGRMGGCRGGGGGDEDRRAEHPGDRHVHQPGPRAAARLANQADLPASARTSRPATGQLGRCYYEFGGRIQRRRLVRRPLPDGGRYRFVVGARGPRPALWHCRRGTPWRRGQQLTARGCWTSPSSSTSRSSPSPPRPARCGATGWPWTPGAIARRGEAGGGQRRGDHEAVANGQGVALLATGNASLVVRDEVIALPVRGISPSHLAKPPVGTTSGPW